MAKKPTLRDIAKESGVALSTVSQVLNNKAGVSTEMRQHVLKVASDMGYQQKITVDTPLMPELSVVGIVTKRRNGDPLVINPFYSHVIAGAERECNRHNISLMYANIEVDDDNNALNYPAMLLDQRVDGVIVVGAFLEKTVAQISHQAGQKIVLVDAYAASEEAEFDSVVTDNVNGAINAVTHLIENGHRHIGLIGSSENSYPSIMERRLGYFEALRQHGIEETYIENGLLERDEAYEATKNLLQKSPEVTAIFACNDNSAIGVMHAVREMGLSVPNDISVVGFDDIDATQEVTPTITTIHVDKVLMGVMALRHLRDRVEDPNRSTIKTILSTHLIIRESVRKL